MESLKELKKAAELAHAGYSKCAAAREAAETAFGEVSKQRETLRTALSDASATLRDATAKAVAAAIQDPSGVARSVASLGALRDSAGVLRQAEALFAAYDFSDGKRAVLVARVAELEAHVAAEEARLAHHESALAESLRAAMELEGGLTIQTAGGTADRMRELIGKLSAELSQSRATLAKFDEETAAARAGLKKESN